MSGIGNKSVGEVLAEVLRGVEYHPKKWRDRSKSALAALEAAGWVCVPKEPTPEMLNAGFEAPGPLELKHNPGEYSGCEWAKMEAAATWAAMLEARPK